jgi:hypothetical protein
MLSSTLNRSNACRLGDFYLKNHLKNSNSISEKGENGYPLKLTGGF